MDVVSELLKHLIATKSAPPDRGTIRFPNGAELDRDAVLGVVPLNNEDGTVGTVVMVVGSAVVFPDLDLETARRLVFGDRGDLDLDGAEISRHRRARARSLACDLRDGVTGVAVALDAVVDAFTDAPQGPQDDDETLGDAAV